MKLLKYIEDKPIIGNKETKKRSASRAVLFDDQNLVPILYVSKLKYHKLPGGGIKSGENKIEGLNREIMEETGCTIEITGEVGEVREYRSKWNLLQTSYCYTGKIISKGSQSFTKKEKNNGFELIWLTLDEAINELKTDNSTNYEDKFIKERELAFLEEAKKLLI